jgi:hypothetical protein
MFVLSCSVNLACYVRVNAETSQHILDWSRTNIWVPTLHQELHYPRLHARWCLFIRIGYDFQNETKQFPNSGTKTPEICKIEIQGHLFQTGGFTVNICHLLIRKGSCLKCFPSLILPSQATWGPTEYFCNMRGGGGGGRNLLRNLPVSSLTF